MYSIDDIRELLNGETGFLPQGMDPGRKYLKDINTLEDASAEEFAFVTNPRYLKGFSDTLSPVVLMARDIFSKLDKSELERINKAVITVANPQAALGRVLSIKVNKCVKKGVSEKASVSKTAVLGSNIFLGDYCVIEDKARIGEGSVIYPGVFIGENCDIGEGCIIYPNVVIREDSKIGDRVIMHGGAVIGADGFGFSTGENGHTKIPQVGNVVIESDVEIGANTAIDRATIGSTKIGSGTKIDNFVHIAHNVKIGKNCLIVAQVGISGSTKIGDNVTIAGQAGITGHLTIGDNVVIGARSGVIGDVASNSVVSGFPARPHKEMMRIIASTYKLPKIMRVFERGKNGD